MPYFGESPLERIVDVYWKKPDGGGGEGGPDDPCGMLYFPNCAPFVGISRWVPSYYQPVMLAMQNCVIVDGQPYPYNALVSLGVNKPYDLYYYGYGATSFKVTMTVNDDTYSPFGIDLILGVWPVNITQTTTPTLTVQADAGSVEVEITPAMAAQGWVISCWGCHPLIPDAPVFGRTNASPARANTTSLTIQTYCHKQTLGAPPPQPPTPGVLPPNTESLWTPGIYYAESPNDMYPLLGPPIPQDMAARRVQLLGPPGENFTFSRSPSKPLLHARRA